MSSSTDDATPNEKLHALLHTLWSKAVHQPHYDKKEWLALQQSLWKLQGIVALHDPTEPAPYRPATNGTSPPNDPNDPNATVQLSLFEEPKDPDPPH